MKFFYYLYALLCQFLIPSRSTWRKTLSSPAANTIWFHAASAGELEVLIPLIEASVSQGRSTCVSIFSNSAESWLQRLPQALLYAGFSPKESDWKNAFHHYGVSEVVTSKYEAWPGLWHACSELGIRINVVCAQMRSSLVWAKRFMRWFGNEIPRLRFFALESEGIPPLLKAFPLAEAHLSVDPRWLRVSVRAKTAKDSPVLQKWIKTHASAPRPYWVIGSAWPEDMEFLQKEINAYPGTVWVVPHQMNPHLKFNSARSVYAHHSNQILVDEMGMLVELYSIADRVWVGGGLALEKNRGIHSTLEPAVYSVPIACGAKNVEKFFETKELQEKKILSVCRTHEDLRNWLSTDQGLMPIEVDEKTKRVHELTHLILTTD